MINSLQFPLEMPAMPPWSSPQIEGKAQRVDIVASGFVDVGGGDLRDRSGERHALKRTTNTRLGNPGICGVEFKQSVSSMVREKRRSAEPLGQDVRSGTDGHLSNSQHQSRNVN